MNKGRMEAFSDGVLAIIITIMVLELKTPHGHDWASLCRLWPVFLSYILSFIYVGIYWNNHHHLLQTLRHVTGGILWANLHLLFWLSLVPFSTSWMGEHLFLPIPTAVYGFTLLMPGIAYSVLQQVIIRTQGPDSLLKAAVRHDFKGKLSVVFYAVAIPLAFVAPWASDLMYLAVALMWLVPDKRIERQIAHPNGTAE